MLDPSPHGGQPPEPHATDPAADPAGAAAFDAEPGQPPALGDQPEGSANHHPDSASGPLIRLDPRWIITERISGVISASVLVVGSFVAIVIFASGWRAVGLALWAVLAVGLFTAAIVAPTLQYRHASYRVTPFGMETRRGVFWRRVTIVPRSRIQHTDVEQGPLLRRFGIAKLVIHTAGTEHSTVPVFGLPRDDAVAIRDELMGLRSESDGGMDVDGV